MSYNPNIWKETEFTNSQGERTTYFYRVDEKGNTLESFPPVSSRDDISVEDRVIWLDPEHNKVENRKHEFLQKRQAKQQRLAEEAKQEKEKKMENPKSQFKMSDLALPSPVKVIKRVLPFIKFSSIADFQLDYVLPKISHLPIENFLRWNEKDVNGKFLHDPEQTLNNAVGAFIRTTGLVPYLNLFMTSNLTIWNITLSRKIEERIEYIKLVITQETNKKDANVIYRQIIRFIKENPVFIFAFDTIKLGIGHGILMQRINATTMSITDPNGVNWERILSEMSKPIKALILPLIKEAGFTSFPDSRCRFQTSRGTCLLWSTFFALYPEKSPQQLSKLIDDVLHIVGLPVTVQNRDAVIMELFYQFIQSPVKARDVNVEEHRRGLGICHKCGGIRPAVKKGKKQSLPKINEF